MGEVVLNNDVVMPLVGLGTYKIKGTNLIFKVIECALENGYRLFDTAEVYDNEEDIGAALRAFLPKYGLKREDVFITSKVGPASHGKEKCKESVLSSLFRLGLDYIDLYLIHWPGIQGLLPTDPLNKVLRKETWLQLENMQRAGKLKCIGVSNYTERHLKDLLSYSNIAPQVLQNECHPHFYQQNIIEFCQRHNIHFQSYSTLGTTTLNNRLLQDQSVIDLSSKYNKSPAQILLKWALQQQISIIPKSTDPSHIRENIQLNFELEINDINFLNKHEVKQKYSWDPTNVI